MRQHIKIVSRITGARIGRTSLLLASVACIALSLSASPALAGTVTNDRPLLFSFDGSDTTAGAFTGPKSIDIDRPGYVYVLNGAGDGKGPGVFDSQRVIDKFNPDGTAANFSGLGRSSLDGIATPGRAFGVEGFSFISGLDSSDVAIDNSAVNPGRIYVSEGGGPIHAFAPDGTYLWTLPRTTARSCGIAVDSEGHLWVGNGDADGEARFKVLEFAPTGSPPAQIGSVTMTHGTVKTPCRLAFDQSGNNLYAHLPSIRGGIDKYVGGFYDSTLVDSAPEQLQIFDVAADQSKASGHIFRIQRDDFAEYEPCGLPGCAGSAVAGSPFGEQVLGDARGIAYNPTKDWVYVSDHSTGTVKVFGPVTSGPVPDVTSKPATAITRTAATAHATINPQGLTHTYHFEWAKGSNPNWGIAQSSPPQSIAPTDSADHEVSFDLTGLAQNSPYSVRLVGTNTDNDLRSYASPPDVFRTLAPPPPTVTIDSISPITTTTAHIAATIDPQEDTTTWRVQKSTDPSCRTGFVDEPLQTIPTPPLGTVAVTWDLTGLLPAQTYCVRVTATNSGGTDDDERVIQTLAIPPSEAAAAFAAPRTDTTARINARINPNGEADFRYRFEWSKDGGATWIPLPERVSTIDAREPIVLAEELSGLDPGATYRYRLALAENVAGPAASLGEEKTFTTRTSAEVEAADPPSCPNADVRAAQHAAYLGSCRGLELVNSPDKGNQAAFAIAPGGAGGAPMSADGERVLWTVIGGAPGGPNGSQSNFLATRTAAGWHSQSTAPPAEQQAGGGALVYFLTAATPNLSGFVFSARISTGLACCPPPTVVRVREGKQDILQSYSARPLNSIYEGTLDLSDDGEHVLFINSDTAQLEDIGAARVGPPAIAGEPVSFMPGGSLSQCGLDVFGALSFGSPVQPGYHWIATTDASRVYFKTPADGNCGGPLGLYVRNRATGETSLLDPAGPTFLRATPDGRAAYFATLGRREPADTNSGGDIYRWEESAGRSSCLTCVIAGGGGLEPENGVFNGILVSDDFSHVYFLSKSQLLPGQGRAGSPNLYTLSGGQVRFIATVDQNALNRNGAPQLSTDGNVLLFGTRAGPALSADVTAAQCIEPQKGSPLGVCQELYRYDDRDSSLECLSCEHDGITTHSFGSPHGRNGLDAKLSGDGATAAFTTQAALLPSDVNQDTDIYEWRDGVLHLITDGVSDFQEGVSAPQMIAVDGDGSDILFGLVPPGGSLTGYERDGVLNLYDARIEGGFPPPSLPVHCEGDACQGPLQAPLAQQQPASSGFVGRGNETAEPRRPCRKGKVRRRGRCVKRHASKPPKHKRRHKRAGQAKQGRAK